MISSVEAISENGSVSKSWPLTSGPKTKEAKIIGSPLSRDKTAHVTRPIGLGETKPWLVWKLRSLHPPLRIHERVERTWFFEEFQWQQ